MESIWSQGCQIRAREPLSGDLECEVAVVGAGMAGVLIAHALQEAGHQVVVLEANRTGSGQTGNTTAKVTAQHGLIYEKLIRTLGKDRARQYGQAHQAAIQAYRDLIRKERIDCGWQDCSAYVYGKDREQLQGEAEAAASLGLPAVFTRDLPPWLPAEGAVRFDHQGQFHPLQFLRAVSGRVTIYENTPVQIAEGDLLYTTRGCTLPGCTRPAPMCWPWSMCPGWMACSSASARTASPCEITGTCSCWGAGDTGPGRTRKGDGMTSCGRLPERGFPAAGRWPTGPLRTA